VHIQDHYSLSRNAAISAQRLGVKSVGTNHFMPENLAPYFPLVSRIRPVFNWVLWQWMAETFNRLHAIASPSSTGAAMVRLVGLRPPVFPISCGFRVDTFRPDPAVNKVAWRERYGIDPQLKIFFFVGRVDKEKHLDVLLHALHLLKRDDIQVVIAGRGADSKRLEALSKKLNLGRKVHFTGFIPSEDLPSVLNSIDVFTMPSEAELLSIATLQAMGCARPVLAANAIALPELVTANLNGLLFPPGDVATAAHCMEWFANHPERLEEMGKASTEKAQSHSVENTLRLYEILYEKLLLNTHLDGNLF
jgi:glycosyltransferase involved in cell wall biosynthesis